MKKHRFTFHLFLLVIFSMPLYLVRMTFFGLPTNVFELLAIISLIVWLRKVFPYAKLSNIPRTVILSTIFILIGTVISIFSNPPYLSGLGILKSWFIIPMLFSFALYALLDSQQEIEKVFQSIYFSIFIVGIIALSYKLFGVVTYDNRLSAFYLSPNYLAMYLAPGIFLGLYFTAKSFSENYSSIKKLLYLFSFLIILSSLFYTFSYGALLSVLLAIFLMLFFSQKTKKLFFVYTFIAAFLLLATQLGSEKFLSLATFSERSSFASRMMIWKSSLMMIEQHPFIGIGPGNFQSYYLSLQLYFPPYLEWAVPQPHNLYLAFWIQAGLIGIVGFLLLLFCVFKILIKLNKKNSPMAILLLSFFIYTTLHGLIDTPYWKNDMSLLFWIFIFLALSLEKLKRTI